MMAPVSSMLWRNFRVYQIFGANTDVGKTIFSTILCRAARSQRKSEKVWYLKPVSTGRLQDADNGHLERFAPGVFAQGMYQFNDPISPHLAAPTPISDDTVLKETMNKIRSNARAGPGFMLVETAGGANSPGPSGTVQAELYRPLRLPIVFVADWHLGGISTSISAFESLKIHGFDIDGVAILRDSYYRNYEYLDAYFKDRNIPVLDIPQPPEPSLNQDVESMSNYYDSKDSGTSNSLDSSKVAQFVDTLRATHVERIRLLETISSRALERIWYPFTQHKSLSADTITAIDSAYGDYFQTFRSQRSALSRPDELPLLQATMDGSASWWTQGIGHANSALTLSAAHAAGRYGHVMFASAVHQPAIDLADSLLKTLQNPRLNRVFYSDNGSTAMEVAVKMALKASCTRYGWDHHRQDVEMIGLKGSYHGDTIGSMDMSEPSVFNDKVEWYKGRGFWFDVPTVKMRKGSWRVERPSAVRGAMGTDTEFPSLPAIFDSGRDVKEEAAIYAEYIRAKMEHLTQEEKRRFGALVIEPVVLGAGGMLLVDPLFQRTLINTIRDSASLIGPSSMEQHLAHPDTNIWTGLPVVADEVFTGLFRLGHACPSLDLLRVSPDISAHAKLLTGGLLPLAATCASESIFNAFLADSKEDALLHGHSYTAHAVGCAVATTSLQLLKKANEDGGWDRFRKDWAARQTQKSAESAVMEACDDNAANIINQRPISKNLEVVSETPQVWSVWSTGFVFALSHATEQVESVWALGSVLAIELKDKSGAWGYASNAAKSLQQELFHGAVGQKQGWNIHSRVLGNILYLMTSQITKSEDVKAWEDMIKEALTM